MRITGNSAAFMAQMRSPVLNNLSQLNSNRSVNGLNVPGMKEIREKLSTMRVDVSDISSKKAGLEGDDAKNNAELTMKEMLAEYLPGGAKHELKLNEGIEGAYQGATARIDALEKHKEYLSMSEEHAKLAQDTSLSDAERDMHMRMADEIKRYVAQSVTGHLENTVQKDLDRHERDLNAQVEVAIKQYFGQEALGQPSEDGYINDADVLTGGAVGRLVHSVRGDLSPTALGLNGLENNYRDVSYEQMKDMITAAQEKIKPAADKLAALYQERTGKEPEKYHNSGQFDPFTPDTIKQGERDLFEEMSFSDGYSDFNEELSGNQDFGQIELSAFGKLAAEAADSRLSTEDIYID